jgi:hypothetical protein
MSKKFTYKSVLINGPFKGTYVEFPYDSVKEFGTKRHIWCTVTFEDYTCDMNLLPNGKGRHWLHLNQKIRNAIGKREGDTVSVTLKKNNKPRTIEIPDYLQWLLENDREMAKYFDRMPISGKKFWVQHIEEPKNDDVKVQRINRMFEYLREHYTGKV